ncbi:unnamed protein product [Staurois parvus]|uniref:Uncharacterized protein n=1 Tax=Staurois parvus TaxID=386267 RepID=A0ABN9CKQ8_9NEOB|nr:unnamed protein product [Staurois parvus]
MYINGWMGAVRSEWPFRNGARIYSLCALPGSVWHPNPVPAVYSGHSRTPIAVRDLCVKSRFIRSLISQSVITCRVVSKMSLLTSLLTTCEIYE